MVSFCYISAWLLLASGVLTHPGHNVADEAAERADFWKRNPATVRSCTGSLRSRGLERANHVRRQGLANDLRAKRSLKSKPMVQRRDFNSYNFTHISNSSEINWESDETLLFADNSSCVLQPEVTEGPYYVNGELIRSDITEDQDGVPLILDIQIIDTSTCAPIPALYMDLWHCNATGVYSGVVSNGNGNSNDTSNLDNTALRGIQQTNINGIVQFETVFPGHYTGRASHIHVLVHNSNDTTIRVNQTLLSSNTSASVHASHVGQMFFDQELISQIDTLSPYRENSQQITLNSDDNILASEADSTDPFVEYVLLGDTLQDGILAWISIGIDPTQNNEVNNAATFYSTGGVANTNSGGAPGAAGGLPGGDFNGSGVAPGNSSLGDGSSPPSSSSIP